ncbi:protein HGH1 homolog [Pithys albifrons albifrons]|uniref:protein HGH1 homolog n=1 Tax=Pithys albifrons albifrons TaxID=3385563 RepID=UPI003A5D11C3
MAALESAAEEMEKEEMEEKRMEEEEEEKLEEKDDEEADEAAAAALSELTALLSPSCPAARAAAEAALALSGSAAGRRLLAGRAEALRALAALAAGSADHEAVEAAAAALLNVSALPAARAPLLRALPALLPALPAGPRCGLLANLARHPRAARAVTAALGPGLAALVETRPPPEHLGPLLCNLSRDPQGRAAILDRDRRLLQRLLPLTHSQDSVELRRGLVGALRNCCFEHEQHEWLLGEQVDVLPFLLLPLAGPEELPEEEMEQLPLDLQYLPQDKQREPQPDIRKMLLETILLLTATKAGRRVVRDSGTYLVLRELHRWETHPEVLSTCHKLIQVLIGDEPGPGMENLLEVTVPEELEQQLRRWDRQEQEQWDRDRDSGDTGTGTP